MQMDLPPKDLTLRCEEVLKQHGRSFRWASWLLPRSVRADAAVAYAFCRLVDDTVDEAESPDAAVRDLKTVEEMVRGESPPSELVDAFVTMCRRRGMSLSPALDLIAGARSDLARVRIGDDESLALYCYRVAGTVGLLMCGILGVKEQKALRHAVHLGMAMQLTNICRDVLEDVGRDRVYLPETRLVLHGCSQQELLDVATGKQRGQANEVCGKVAQSVRELLMEAELLYASGRVGMQYLRGRAKLAVMVAGALYREIGIELLDKRGADALRGRVVVSTWRKCVLTLKEVFGYIKNEPMEPVVFRLPGARG